MSERVEELIQKINFIETDIELQKQILASIPSDREDEMRKVVEKIKGLKNRIQDLLAEIERIDPDEYARIKKLEASTLAFRKMTEGKTFTQVTTLDHSETCQIPLAGGEGVPCLVAARDEEGNWTGITLEGDTVTYSAEQVETE